MEENTMSNEYYTLTDEDGNELEFEMIGQCEMNGVTYYAMIPAESDDDGEFYEYTILKSVMEDGEVNVRNVPNLLNGGDQQSILVHQALCLAIIHGAHRRRACPAFVVLGAFVLADPADPVGEFQLFRLKKVVYIQRKLRKFGFQQFTIHYNSSKILRHPAFKSSHVAVKSPVYQGSATS